MVIVLFSVFLTSMINLQFKYEHCKTVDFEGEYCKTQKKLSELKK